MAQSSPFPPVYPGLTALPDDLTHRGQPRFLRADATLLISVTATTAIITHICQHAIRDAAEFCRINNINTFSDEGIARLNEFIRERPAIRSHPTEANAQDVTGRSKGGGKSVARVTGKSAKSR